MGRLRTTSLIAFVLIAAIGLTGCGSLAPLVAIIDATEAAIPVLQAVGGIPIPPEVPQYLADVSDCIGNVVNPTPQSALDISQCLAGKVAPQLSGLPSAIVQVVGLVIKDVETFLTQNPPAATSTASSAGMAFFDAKAPKRLSNGDVNKLRKLQGRAKAASKALRAIGAKH